MCRPNFFRNLSSGCMRGGVFHTQVVPPLGKERAAPPPRGWRRISLSWGRGRLFFFCGGGRFFLEGPPPPDIFFEERKTPRGLNIRGELLERELFSGGDLLGGPFISPQWNSPPPCAKFPTVGEKIFLGVSPPCTIFPKKGVF